MSVVFGGGCIRRRGKTNRPPVARGATAQHAARAAKDRQRSPTAGRSAEAEDLAPNCQWRKS
eukprot:4823123-Lingulodinium_polyedra.AAC.1